MPTTRNKYALFIAIFLITFLLNLYAEHYETTDYKNKIKNSDIANAYVIDGKLLQSGNARLYEVTYKYNDIDGQIRDANCIVNQETWSNISSVNGRIIDIYRTKTNPTETGFKQEWDERANTSTKKILIASVVMGIFFTGIGILSDKYLFRDKNNDGGGIKRIKQGWITPGLMWTSVVLAALAAGAGFGLPGVLSAWIIAFVIHKIFIFFRG
jgi:hypothetical protein